MTVGQLVTKILEDTKKKRSAVDNIAQAIKLFDDELLRDFKRPPLSDYNRRWLAERILNHLLND